MKALRTIRLDSSDTFVFERAAQPGEWAVSGAFLFASVDPSMLKGKARAAFRSGFLGIETLGWSTLVQIVQATETERARAVDMLAQRLVEHFGAPSLATARVAAEEEIDFAVELADQPSGMLAAVSRTTEGGSIRESFRSLQPAANKPTSAYAFFEAPGEDEELAKEIDLASLAKRPSR
jgi:hypothetical protein